MKFSVIERKSLWWSLSGAAIIGSIMAMAISFASFNAPLRPSLDFVGGTKIQLELDCSVAGNCDKPLETAPVQAILTEQGLGKSSVQIIDKYTLSIRTQTLDVDQRTRLQSSVQETIGTFDPETIQIDTVGPSIGQELFVAGLLALIVSFFGIIVYLSFRFQFDYALFAILALFHDAFITAGVFSVLGLVAGVEVDSLFLVALLTIIGFSVNDTVVIYDRIRETIAVEPEQSMNQIVDDAVNQTLTRSINTTVTTLLPLVGIFLFGGATLKYFALALIIGFSLGSYSSIFFASPLLAWWRENKKVNPDM
ncbi:MAG: protein translocase subunit SecF [Moorea sp. SIO2B7]|nr:protein translocase subunit SecF [Moorena sp. SIO2B7]